MFMKDIGIVIGIAFELATVTYHDHDPSRNYLCNRDTSLSFTWSLERIRTIWSALLRKRFSNPRNRLEVQCVGLRQQLRHQKALTPCHPFLLVTRMRPQAHKMRVASVWVFSFTFCIFNYCLSIVIEQTAHNLGVSTSVSALEISCDLPPVSVPAAGPNLVQYILNNLLITASIRLSVTTSMSPLRFPCWRLMIPLPWVLALMWSLLY